MVLRQDAKLAWAESDAKYMARGRRKALRRSPDWETELAEMNKGKVGRPFKHHRWPASPCSERYWISVSVNARGC